MSREPVVKFLKKLPGPFFTTRDVSHVSGKTLSTVSQGLGYLEKHGVVTRVYRGIWTDRLLQDLSAFDLVPYLMPARQAYVSFISALHLHGMIEQIPQEVTLASTAHSRTFRTRIATFSVHRIAPDFFFGFDWYQSTGTFLIASPEKALLDSFYLSTRKGKSFGHFPELSIPEEFDFGKARQWCRRIKDPRLRTNVIGKLDKIDRDRQNIG